MTVAVILCHPGRLYKLSIILVSHDYDANTLTPPKMQQKVVLHGGVVSHEGYIKHHHNLYWRVFAEYSNTVFHEKCDHGLS